MTATTGNQPTIPFRRGPTPSNGLAVLDGAMRNVHALTAVWWHVPLARAGYLLSTAVAELRTRLQAWWSWRSTQATLLGLDDRTLADIGLDRQRVQRITAADLRRYGQGHDVLRTLQRMPF
ncbi:MAG: DUF1127 domain-containing protein [Halofilum sp. (in: g-proteobacteria)]|nr:DUF1127 domain-containing protein [Halofilum sp. (in: g-proteobacteria)]